MAEGGGRAPSSLKRILGLISANNYLTTDLVLGIRDWDKGLREGEFRSNARSKEEAIVRVQALMRGLENPGKLATSWLEQDGTISPESEAGLRGRLSDEMAWCLRKGGVLLPSCELRGNVASVTEQVIYQLKPELQAEVQREGQQRSVIEGSSTGIS